MGFACVTFRCLLIQDISQSVSGESFETILNGKVVDCTNCQTDAVRTLDYLESSDALKLSDNYPIASLRSSNCLVELKPFAPN